MKPLLVTLSLGSALGLAMTGCKKAEQSPPPSVKSESPAPRPAEPAAAPVKARASVAENESKDAVRLRVKWPLGARYVFRMDLDQHSTNHIPQFPKPMEQNVLMSMTYAVTPIKQIPDDGREIELEFLANEMEVKMGEQAVLSFDSKEQAKDENPITAPFRKMIGSKIHLEVDANGKVQKVLGLDEWHKSMAGDNAGPGAGMLAQQFNEGYFRQILDFGAGFPNKPVQVGDTWPYHLDLPVGPMGKISGDSTVIFKGWEDHLQHQCAALNLAGTFKGSAAEGQAGPMGKMSIENGTAIGTSWFDPGLGMLVESIVDQTLRMKGEMPGPPGGNRPAAGFTIEIGQKVTMTLVEAGKPKE